MRSIAAKIFIFAMTTFGVAHAGSADVRGCAFDVKARCASGTARVTLAGNQVTKLEIDVYWCGERGRPGYTCTIDVSRGDKESKWSEAGSTTLIDNASPFTPSQPDRVAVTVGRDVSIDLKETQSLGRCGAGAELPRAIIIPAQGKTCGVTLGAP